MPFEVVELSIIIPTLNEEANIRPLYEELAAILGSISWQMIVVDDDSSDATRQEVKALGDEYSNVAIIHRIGRRGLSSACLEGMAAADSDHILVMDADMQHDSSVIPDMLALMQAEACDLVIASRFKEASRIKGLSPLRRMGSKWVNRGMKAFTGSDVTDPLSGFFMLTRELYDKIKYKVSGVGFKILIDIIMSAPGRLNIRELAFTFRERNSGESKLDISIVSEFLGLVIEKLSKGRFPIRFLSFLCVGCVGAVGHFTMMLVMYKLFDTSFLLAQLVATYFAIIVNFFLNNAFTYRSQRLRGLTIIRGLLLFALVCSAGAINNLIVADALYSRGIHWLLASLSGAIYGSVWNYFMSSILVWFKKPV